MQDLNLRHILDLQSSVLNLLTNRAYWLPLKDSNLHIHESKSCTLPFGQGAKSNYQIIQLLIVIQFSEGVEPSCQLPTEETRTYWSQVLLCMLYGKPSTKNHPHLYVSFIAILRMYLHRDISLLIVNWSKWRYSKSRAQFGKLID